MPKKRLQGTIISNKMMKTVVVKTERTKKHPKYHKRFRVFNKYKAHYDGADLKPGDKVVIEECKPISKDKKWRIINPKSKAQMSNQIQNPNDKV